MNDQMIKKQSEAAYNQWAPQWREHAKLHSKLKMKPLTDFYASGIGKPVLCVANGYSFEENIETIKKLQHNVDILCCDKTLGHLLDHGITPTFCMVCDANVDFETYLKPWADKVKNIILFSNVCANPRWTFEAQWKDHYFFINKDILESEKEFMQLSGCQNVICAGTNVSNAMVILLTQCDNDLRQNFFGYDKIILIGFDYSWKFEGKYYAFDQDGGGKASYMRHSYIITQSGKIAYTSGNLVFSRDWLANYIKVFNIPVVQCAEDSLLFLGKTSKLEEQMSYRYKPEDAVMIRKAGAQLHELNKQVKEINNRLSKAAREHFWAHAATV